MRGFGPAAEPPERGAVNLEWARQWVRALTRLGVEEVQMAPGSRSTPLVLACHEDETLRIRVHIDERSAAFFALGYGRRRLWPSLVITTSGTAVANLLPAVVEAAASDVPILLLTADRPPRLRGLDANQTIVQPGIFSAFTRRVLDVPLPSDAGLGDGVPRDLAEAAMSAALGPPSGPVHVNMPFEKPLHPAGVGGLQRGHPPGVAGREGTPPSWTRRNPSAPASAALVSDGLRGASRPVFIAGPSSDPDREGSAVLDLARRLGAPVLADPLSGARFHPSGGEGVVSTYSAFLAHPESRARLQPDLIIRTGRTFTSASLETALLSWTEAAHVVVDGGSLRKDHLGLADKYVHDSPATVFPDVDAPRCDDEWLSGWMHYDAAARDGLREALSLPDHEGAIVAAAVQATPVGATVFVSNSMPVRDLDLTGDPDWGHRRVLGNRGASGIDGIISSALGAAAGGTEPVVAVLGDLAFLHDVNGLLRGRDPDLNAVLVVIDNDGGGIFHMLPIRAFEPAFTRYFATPHGLDLAGGARLYEVPFRDAETAADVAREVREALERGGVHIVRIRTDRDRNQAAHEKTRALVGARLQTISTEDTD